MKLKKKLKKKFKRIKNLPNHNLDLQDIRAIEIADFIGNLKRLIGFYKDLKDDESVETVVKFYVKTMCLSTY